MEAPRRPFDACLHNHVDLRAIRHLKTNLRRPKVAGQAGVLHRPRDARLPDDPNGLL